MQSLSGLLHQRASLRENIFPFARLFFSLLLFCLLAAPLAAGPRIEDMLEKCMIEAQKRGHDIANDEIVNRISDAVMNHDNKALRKYCPKTLRKAHKK